MTLGSCCKRDLLAPIEGKRQSGEDRQIDVKLDALQAANAERRERVFALQVGELLFDQCAAAVERAEPFGVPCDAREQTASRRERKGWLLAFCASERDDGIDAASLALGMDARVVVALVHCEGLGLEAASLYRVEQGSDEQRLMVPSGASLPSQRQARNGADGKVDLEPVVRTGSAGADSGAVPPGCIRIAVPLPLRASVVDGAMPIPPRGNVGGVNRNVTAKIRVLLPERCRERVEARFHCGPVLAELRGEAVHRPHARASSEGVLQARMLSDQGCDERPRRKREHGLDETRAEQRPSAVTLAATLVPGVVQISDERCEFGRVEK